MNRSIWAPLSDGQLDRFGRWLVLAVAVVLAAVLPATAGAIVNGVPADRAAFPFYTVVGGGTHCGGALIAPDRVLTAAHCVVTLEGARVVWVGPADERRTVTHVAQHPEYVKYERGPGGGFGLYPADLMVLQLDRPVTDVAPLPIAAPADGLTAPGQVTTVIGRGVPFTGQEPRDLIFRSASMTLVPDARCGSVIGGELKQSWSLCALDPRGITDPKGPKPFMSTCHGDSGGPLLAAKDGVTYTLGTVSGAEECGGTTGDVFGDAVVGRGFALAPAPRWAPYAAARPVLRGRARAGGKLRCDVAWIDPPRSTIYELTVGRGLETVERSSSRATFRVREQERGRPVSCRVIAFTGGGSFVTKRSKLVRIAR